MTPQYLSDRVCRERRLRAKLEDIGRVPDDNRRTFYFRQHVAAFARALALRRGIDPPDHAVILAASDMVARSFTPLA